MRCLGFIVKTIREHASDLDRAAKIIVDQAYEQGSPHNLTIQIVRIEALPNGEASEVFGQWCCCLQVAANWDAHR